MEQKDMWLIERSHFAKGIKLTCGVDEAGRGPLAGPVCAAAVILPPELEIPGLDDSKKLTDKRRRELFESACEETLTHLYNHPCVCCYTIFNEGWGQYDADRMYEKLKKQDPSRIFDTTSGWFEERNSDVKSEHIYFKKIDLKPSEKPLFLSEFGGYSCKIPEHSFNLDKTYGYRFFSDQSDFMNALEKLYLEEILPSIARGLCATVLTQLTDVEDETNGLLTYDRKILKVDVSRMKAIAKALFSAFEKQTKR